MPPRFATTAHPLQDNKAALGFAVAPCPTASGADPSAPPAPPGRCRRRPSETLRSLMESIFEAQREDPKLHVGIQRKPCGFVPPAAEYLRRASPAQRAQLHAAASAVVCAELARCSAGSVASSAAGEQRREYLLDCQAKLSMLVEGCGSPLPAESLEQQLRHADSAWSSDACVHGRCSLSRRAGEVKVVGFGSSRGVGMAGVVWDGWLLAVPSGRQAGCRASQQIAWPACLGSPVADLVAAPRIPMLQPRWQRRRWQRWRWRRRSERRRLQQSSGLLRPRQLRLPRPRAQRPQTRGPPP